MKYILKKVPITETWTAQQTDTTQVQVEAEVTTVQDALDLYQAFLSATFGYQIRLEINLTPDED